MLYRSSSSEPAPAGTQSQLSRWIPAAVLIALGLLIAFACRPYPRFTHDPPAPEAKAEDSDRTTEREPRSGGDSSQDRKSTGDGGWYGDNPSEQIDPVIFGRIVDDYLGVPYQLGGSNRKGIDCSGLVQNVYKEYSGKRLPPTVKSLYRLDRRVSFENLAYGDLIFFAFDGSRADHVGIYIGDGRFVHSAESRGVVVDSLDDTAFADSYRGARRVQ